MIKKKEWIYVKQIIYLVINGKKKIAEESQLLTKEIESELKELLSAKE